MATLPPPPTSSFWAAFFLLISFTQAFYIPGMLLFLTMDSRHVLIQHRMVNKELQRRRCDTAARQQGLLR